MINARLQKILSTALEYGANDIFLTENKIPRIRVSGNLEKLNFEKITHKDVQEFWELCNCKSENNKDFDASINILNNRYRINLFHQFGELSAALRPIQTEIPELASLGLPDNMLKEWMQKNSGIIFVTGPTNSGKSTTLASCIQWINDNLKRHIVTIEDPIEYMFFSNESMIHQRQIGADTKNFATGLRSALRQSSDIIFLGEIRDSKTANVALQAAETGHLVITTIHSANTALTIERITNLFDPKERASALILLSSHLIGILCQKLIPNVENELFLAVEHLENKGAISKWIKNSAYSNINDFINKTDNPHNCSFLNYLVAATKSGVITPEIGRDASGKEQEFDRALRGIN